MSKELQGKIEELIDDYLKNGLHITLHPGCGDNSFWVSIDNPEHSPFIKSLNYIADSIGDTEQAKMDDLEY